jgi:hypothetical protein
MQRLFVLGKGICVDAAERISCLLANTTYQDPRTEETCLYEPEPPHEKPPCSISEPGKSRQENLFGMATDFR